MPGTVVICVFACVAVTGLEVGWRGSVTMTAIADRV